MWELRSWRASSLHGEPRKWTLWLRCGTSDDQSHFLFRSKWTWRRHTLAGRCSGVPRYLVFRTSDYAPGNDCELDVPLWETGLLHRFAMKVLKATGHHRTDGSGVLERFVCGAGCGPGDLPLRLNRATRSGVLRRDRWIRLGATPAAFSAIASRARFGWLQRKSSRTTVAAKMLQWGRRSGFVRGGIASGANRSAAGKGVAERLAAMMRRVRDDRSR